MHSTSKKNSALLLVFLLLAVVICTPYSSAESATFNTDGSHDEQLYLLRGEHYLYINATENVDTFQLRFVFPPDYQYQVPLYLHIFNDTTANITHYEIQDDIYDPNKLIVFSLGPMNQSEGALIHFTFWVLVKNHAYDDLPRYVRMPRRSDLPEIPKTWVVSTKVVQTHRILIKLKARQLQDITKNMIRYADTVASYIKEHRYWLFILQLRLGVFFNQDAITTLLLNGENVGRGHLACALLRTKNIPARMLLAHNDQGFWTQMHYMVEYYVPEYGWVLLDPTYGETPYATYHQIINRVCHPEDEQDTKADYIIPRMRGEERWLWLNTPYVRPWYVDCEQGSKSQMFTEAALTTTIETADHAIVLSKKVFNLYQRYLGANLTNSSYYYFNQGIHYQQQALEKFTNYDILDYLAYMDKAYTAYQQIELS